MRIAFFSPLNPQRSGISDYSEELLPYLARHGEVELFVDDYAPNNLEIAKSFAIHSFRDFEQLQPRRYDIALYQMGNHPCHEYIYKTLLRYPGVTVLHDFILHHFILEITVAKGDDTGYVREMGYAYGSQGTEAARDALRARGNYPTLQYPLNERTIDSSLGLIVHSEFARQLVRKSHPNKLVARIPHGMDVDGAADANRSSLGLPKDVFVVGTFGLATTEKRIDVLLKAFKEFRRAFPESLLLLVGTVPQWNDIGVLVKTLGLEDSVTITGFTEKHTLQEYIRVSDVCVNLRYPTCGETSGVVLRCMSAAKPVIVSNVGSFSELPDSASIKIFVDEDEVDNLTSALNRLAGSKALRDEMGRAAQEHVRTENSWANTAKAYVDFIRGVLDGV